MKITRKFGQRLASVLSLVGIALVGSAGMASSSYADCLQVTGHVLATSVDRCVVSTPFPTVLQPGVDVGVAGVSLAIPLP